MITWQRYPVPGTVNHHGHDQLGRTWLVLLHTVLLIFPHFPFLCLSKCLKRGTFFKQGALLLEKGFLTPSLDFGYLTDDVVFLFRKTLKI